MYQPSARLSSFEREEVKARLAKEVLAEVPHQVTSYMKSHNIPARPPQLVQMPRASLDSAHGGGPSSPPLNQAYPSIYPEPPPSYTATVNDDPVKQPPSNPNYFSNVV